MSTVILAKGKRWWTDCRKFCVSNRFSLVYISPALAFMQLICSNYNTNFIRYDRNSTSQLIVAYVDLCCLFKRGSCAGRMSNGFFLFMSGSSSPSDMLESSESDFRSVNNGREWVSAGSD